MFYFKYNLIFNLLLYICIVYCMAIFCLPGLQVSGHDTTCADFWTNFLPPFAEGYFYKSENNKIDSHIHIKKKKRLIFHLPRTQRHSFPLEANIKEMNLAFLGYLKPQSFGCLLDTGKTLWRFIFYALHFVMQDVKSATWVWKQRESHKILGNHSISCSRRNLWDKEEKFGGLTFLEHPFHRWEREENIPSEK